MPTDNFKVGDYVLIRRVNQGDIGDYPIHSSYYPGIIKRILKRSIEVDCRTKEGGGVVRKYNQGDLIPFDVQLLNLSRLQRNTYLKFFDKNNGSAGKLKDLFRHHELSERSCADLLEAVRLINRVIEDILGQIDTAKPDKPR